jgi:hypothetical protein
MSCRVWQKLDPQRTSGSQDEEHEDEHAGRENPFQHPQDFVVTLR